MTCVGHYEIKSLIYEMFMEKKRCKHKNGMIENELMYLYQAFQSNVMNASTTYINYTS
jgi:hypothetical protein